MAVIRKLCVLVSRARCRFLGALLVFWVIITLIYSKWSISGSNPAKRATLIPNKIWQLWVHPTEQPSQDWRESSHTWIDLNPSWDYKIEIMTDSYAQAYVQKVFKDRQDIVDAFARANKTIQRADLLRYLWLLEKGGVYSDLDARCTKPLRDWIPPRYRSSTGLVIGIEVDDYFEDRYDPDVPYIQLCQWTIMARPYHPTMTKVVDTVVRRLQDWEAGDVEELTGPKVFTEAVFESLSELSDRQNDLLREEVSGLTEPHQIDDVLILPINAFGSGQAHSGSKEPDKCDPFVVHSFAGSWRHEDQT